MKSCGCFWRTPTILFNGELFPCVLSISDREEMLLGKINRMNTFSKLWSGNKNQKFRKLSILNKLNQIRYCKNCFGGECIPENLDKLSKRDISALSPKNQLKIKWLVIELSDSCNLSCIMCPRNKRENQGFIEFNLFKNIIEDIKEKKWIVDTLTLHLRGEPLMHPKIIQILQMLNNYRDHINKIMIDTNGHFLDLKLIKELVKINNLVLTFSLDAASKRTYNLIRKGGNFNKVKKNVQNYFKMKNNEEKINTRLQFIIQRNNFFEIERFIEFWSEFFQSNNIPFTIFDATHPKNIPLKEKNQIFFKYLEVNPSSQFVNGYEEDKMTQEDAINLFNKSLKPFKKSEHQFLI